MQEASENLVEKTEFVSDFVQEMEEGNFGEESFLATYTHDPNATQYNDDDDRYVRMVF